MVLPTAEVRRFPFARAEVPATADDMDMRRIMNVCTGLSLGSPPMPTPIGW